LQKCKGEDGTLDDILLTLLTVPNKKGAYLSSCLSYRHSGIYFNQKKLYWTCTSELLQIPTYTSKIWQLLQIPTYTSKIWQLTAYRFNLVHIYSHLRSACKILLDA
jgi:hypothetical protein